MKVLNARLVGKNVINAVYCGRPSIFGNPFYMKDESMRNIVCDKYKAWIYEDKQAWLRERMKQELKDKNLICWCSPKRCHCETILEIVNT